MCLCLFDDSPVADDDRSNRYNKFKTGMKDAPCADPVMFCGSICCFPCANCYLRHKALEGKVEDYTCCQGYYDCACFKAGSIGDAGNPVCLALEGFCCTSCAVSSTRMYIMDKYDLSTDPCDNQIIRFNNFMQMLSCVCSILAIVDPSFQDLAELIRFIADIVYTITASCMNAQGHYELTEREKAGELARIGATPGYSSAPKHEPPMDRANVAIAQPQPVAVAQAQPQRTFLVVIPPNVYAGTQLQVTTPEGQNVMFAVPPGATAGQQVMVPY